MSDDEFTIDMYSDPVSQRVSAVATLLASADSIKDPDFKSEALELAKCVRSTIEKPKATVSAIQGSKAK